MKRTLCTLLTTLMLPPATIAATFTFPTVTSMKYEGTTHYSGIDEDIYSYKVSPIQVTDNRITSEMSVAAALSILVGAPVNIDDVYGATKVKVGRGSSGMDPWRDTLPYTNETFIKYMQRYTSDMIQNAGVRVTTMAGQDQMCITNRIIWRSTTSWDWWQLYNVTWGLDSVDNCVSTPPKTGWCSMLTPEVDINFGLLSVEKATGSEQERRVHVNCTTKMKYALTLLGGADIPLDNGMTANVMTNGVATGEPLNGNKGDNTVDLRATLRGKPSRTGAFAGSGIMVVSYP